MPGQPALRQERTWDVIGQLTSTARLACSVRGVSTESESFKLLEHQKVNAHGRLPNGVDFLARGGAGRAKLLLSRIPAASAAPIPAAP
jgi:hypothetical protein